VLLNLVQLADASSMASLSMHYFLEVQQMALQQAGGKPGQEAKAAAVHLLQALPQSAILARCVALSSPPMVLFLDLCCNHGCSFCA
jgi:hypothetical protein